MGRKMEMDRYLALSIVLLLVLAIPIATSMLITPALAQTIIAERIAPTFKATQYIFFDNENSVVAGVYDGYIYLVTVGSTSNYFKITKIDLNTMNIISSINESTTDYPYLVQAKFGWGYLYIAVNIGGSNSYLYVYDPNLTRVAIYDIKDYFASLGYDISIAEVYDFEIMDRYIFLAGIIGNNTIYGFIGTITPTQNNFVSIKFFSCSYTISVAKINSTDILVLATDLNTLYHVKIDTDGNIVSIDSHPDVYGEKIFVVGNYIVTDYIQVLDLSTFNTLYEYPLYPDTIVPISSDKIAYMVYNELGIIYNYSYAIATVLPIADCWGGSYGDIYNSTTIVIPYTCYENGFVAGIAVLEEIPSTFTPTTITTTTTSTTTIIQPVPVYHTTTITTVEKTPTGMRLEWLLIAMAIIALGAISIAIATRK